MRQIIHVDMNAFFASCHQAQNPQWQGKPLLVAGDPQKRHGIILTASYEARKFGVKTAMAVWQAKKLCPQGIYISPDHKLYSAYSKRIMAIMEDYTPLVEPFSIDEAWLDVTGSARLFGTTEEIGRLLQQRILDETGIPCSVGISGNKFLAKMASERQKPQGFTILWPRDVPEVLWPLPVEEMVGVGRKMAPALHEMGIETIGELAAMPLRLLVSRFGVAGESLHHLANGRDDSPVDPTVFDTVKSVGNSLTLPRDINDPEDVARVLLKLSEKVGRRLRQSGNVARTVTLTVKDQNFVSVTRSRTLHEPTGFTDVIYKTAVDIHQKQFEPWRKVRLLGVSVSNLLPADGGVQLSLFGASEERMENLTRVTDRIRDRYGDTVIGRARLCKEKETPPK
ncbi:DNA polymerase IV [Dethiobacter alkaliphilus]|uniref:DNA polymerase IV n=1 Tax=Dethiobacter alkaliphilus AHT 1 TaxID=555088 RepID=C0GDP3_DETAL|nr:DNA polymerase IV [Dethiobacter alkaliphilus]EEG78526.1 DNA-directed DNA polymerase [Dethiobacter alkaliphilus AHT 1]